MSNGIQHVFVLMLENRSFDHMLGFSGISGTDAVSGGHTGITGLVNLSLLRLVKSFNTNSVSGVVQKKGQTWPPPAISVRDLFISNQFNGQTYRAAQPADFAMPIGPGHEFSDVLLQLCGTAGENAYLAALTNFNNGGAAPEYPQVESGGFIASYVAEIAESGLAGQSPAELMKCYSNQTQLPVLSRLAQEFVVCDNWYCSLPGPTWPNRFFAHAASSGGLDHSPTDADMGSWQLDGDFNFANGTIFVRMNQNDIAWRVYAGDEFPIVAAVQGVGLFNTHDYSDFAQDVAQANYPVSYTFIEPNYGDIVNGSYQCGTSQHPLDDVTRGEVLIKATYEAIRNSPIWNSSLMIITWDEHGGFYDHVPPPAAAAPGDTAPGSKYNLYGFAFNQFGPRVPTIVISPLIPRNLIDHRLYDHASIPATLGACFGIGPMTRRDATANNLMLLVSLASPRGDAPAVLPAAAASGVGGCDPVSFDVRVATNAALPPKPPAVPVTRPLDSINEENLPGFLLVVLKSDLALSPPEQKPAIIARFNTIKTRAEASEYTEEVRAKVRVARNTLSQTKRP
ncbi:MAG: hypothetical protein JO097_17175 [Acidobacteriaceae bacterium]|nr:hypothetical protein [Acidobacteriaceae bacterium]MBV9297186.1 hypothetical protein [Acidobacteriaceae bacterium]MBV9765403.1 hypothetical protein [Acidobacteriaceae bacterium]